MELLAPAGSYEAAKAAVNAGADAIYMGGPLFSARAYAASSLDGAGGDIIPGDPESDPLLKALRYCHMHRVKVYMTVNTLMKQGELKELEGYLAPYVNAKVDAFIVQDIGLMRWLKSTFPQVPLHVSTQAAVTGPRFAGRLKEYGLKRVVPARELSLPELKAIADTGIEVEAFVHGALCFSYSGQCLMSSFLGCRSGNRGRCAGPCRLPVALYDAHGQKIGLPEEQYLLSMKDLCTLGRLKELEKAGVCSLKIEGRMKSPLYVAGVTSIYRSWLDGAGSFTKQRLKDDMKKLAEIYDRGGFTDGYLDAACGRDMLTLYEKKELRVPDPELMCEIDKTYISGQKAIPVRLKGQFTEGKPAWLQIETTDGAHRFKAEGQIAAKAIKVPTSKKDILEKILAFGNSDFDPVDVDIEVGESIFYPAGACKELRRSVCEGLENSILTSGS